MSRDTEAAILGACMIRKDGLGVVSEILTPDDFESPAHGTIFKAMLSLGERLEQVDGYVLEQELGDSVKQCGGREYIQSLKTLWVYAGNLRELAEGLRTEAQTRAARRLWQQAEGKGLQGAHLLAYLQDGLYQIDRQRKTGSTMRKGLEALAYEVRNPSDPDAFCAFPWQKVQWLTNGLRPGTLTVLAGEPGSGKTAAALAIAQHNLHRHKRVLIVSLEMSLNELAIRTAQTVGFDTEAYHQHRESQEGGDQIDGMLTQACWDHCIIEQVERVGQVYTLARKHRPDLVIVDYIQLLDQEGLKQVEALSKQTRGFKVVAGRYSLPMLVLSQLSRSHEGGMNLDRLRGSGTLGQDADTVLFVERDRDSEGVLTPDGRYYVAKSRMGVTGKMPFMFDGKTQHFEV